MIFNAEKFLNDHSIPFTTDTINTDKEGWLGISCPLCDDPSDHGGFNVNDNFYKCWRCGWHSLIKIISALLVCSEQEAKHQLGKYYGGRRSKIKLSLPSEHRKAEVELPPGTIPLNEIHKNYLVGRNFDPEKLESIWDLKGTGQLGPYKYRIIAPIYYKHRLVSFQGRDYTDKQKLRYKACPSFLEAVSHNDVLYGLDKTQGDTVIVCEGIADVWRMGVGSVATFGISFTTKQIILLRKFKRIVIVFDASDIQAPEQARKLSCHLDSENCEVTIVDLPEGDPADLTDDDAKEIVNTFI